MKAQEYQNYIESTTKDQIDSVSLEEFKFDDKAHPRSVMLIRRPNGIPYPFLVQSVIQIVDQGNGRDPETREPFSQLTITRAKLYAKCQTIFPKYQLGDMDSVDLYQRWLQTYDDPMLSKEQKEKTRLEAQCFLQAEDLLDMFQIFRGKGSALNRDDAKTFLQSSPRKWLLRNCSLQDTQYNKAFVLTMLNHDEKLIHFPIIQKVGEGFYFGCLVRRGANCDSKFNYMSVYPTIIHLLQQEIEELKID